MKITRTEVFVVDVPYIQPVRQVGWANPTFVVIRIQTDAGLTGLGESWGGDPERVRAQADDLVGYDPLAMSLRTLDSPFQSAVFDIVGKALNVPAHRLIGDRCRERVPVAFWSCHMPPEETAKEAERAAKLGFKVHKLKARSWDIVKQVQLISKAAGPDYAIRIDPNTEFTHPEVAIKIARQLEGYNVESYEDPVLKDDFRWTQFLREKTDIPQALHLGRSSDVLRAVAMGAVDRINLSGNLKAILDCAAVVEAAHLPMWHQIAGLSLGIQATFAVHLGCTLKNAWLPCDELPFIHENDLIHGALVVEKGEFILPTGPGLGIELDESAVERYRVG